VDVAKLARRYFTEWAGREGEEGGRGEEGWEGESSVLGPRLTGGGSTTNGMAIWQYDIAIALASKLLASY
jgi:hypothetical protein